MILTAAVAAAAVTIILLALSTSLWTWFHSHRMKPFINFRFLDSGFSSRAHVPLNAFIFWSIKSHRLISVHQFNCGMPHTVHQPYCLLGFVQPIRCQIYTQIHCAKGRENEMKVHKLIHFEWMARIFGFWNFSRECNMYAIDEWLAESRNRAQFKIWHNR